MTKFDLKSKALAMRKKGKSLREISSELSISKSTASLWCAAFVLSQKQKAALEFKMERYRDAARKKAWDTNRRKKVDLIESFKIEGVEQIGSITKKEFMVAGLCLYWAEGSKKDTKLSIVNSDPTMVLFMFNWFKKIMGVKKEEFMPRIFINHEHSYRIDTVLNFWASLLDLPISQFGNPTFLKINQKKKYDNHETYFGVLALRISKGTRLKYKILGQIEALKNQYMSA
jgi:hypothetical protein